MRIFYQTTVLVVSMEKKFKLNDSAMMKSSMKKVKGSKGKYFPKTVD